MAGKKGEEECSKAAISLERKGRDCISKNRSTGGFYFYSIRRVADWLAIQVHPKEFLLQMQWHACHNVQSGRYGNCW